MEKKIPKIKTTRLSQKKFEQMSPFEMKNTLKDLAAHHTNKSTHAMLDAGRGNPNWVAAIPREAFFTPGTFGIAECRRTMSYSQ
jgi:aspartate 4-decarboxylase